MELGLDIVSNKGVDICVGSDSRAGTGLNTEDGAERGSGTDLPSELYSLPHQRDIGRVGQAARIEGRGVEGVVCGDI